MVPELQHLAVGDTIPDWGGRESTLTLVAQDRYRYLLHASRRGSVSFTWTLVLAREGRAGTRVQSRVRLGPVKHEWLAERVGGALDLLNPPWPRPRPPGTRRLGIVPYGNGRRSGGCTTVS